MHNESIRHNVYMETKKRAYSMTCTIWYITVATATATDLVAYYIGVGLGILYNLDTVMNLFPRWIDSSHFVFIYFMVIDGLLYRVIFFIFSILFTSERLAFIYIVCCFTSAIIKLYYDVIFITSQWWSTTSHRSLLYHTGPSNSCWSAIQLLFASRQSAKWVTNCYLFLESIWSEEKRVSVLTQQFTFLWIFSRDS